MKYPKKTTFTNSKKSALGEKQLPQGAMNFPQGKAQVP